MEYGIGLHSHPGECRKECPGNTMKPMGDLWECNGQCRKEHLGNTIIAVWKLRGTFGEMWQPNGFHGGLHIERSGFKPCPGSFVFLS